MEAERFDALTRAINREGSSRRSLLRRATGGGLASLLAALGITFGDTELAGAKTCQQKCKKRKTPKKRRKCRKRCGNAGTSVACTTNGQCTGLQVCVGGNCVTPNSPCGDNEDCDGGLACVAGTCVGGNTCQDEGDCVGDLLCLGGQCLLGTDCDDDDECDLLEICVLGLCI